ncbi:MAG TPA: glycosyltransferase family 2 protein [Gaiellales bacterium]|nr:glycosyltransferase family 2 protein [Gaiellales bacterium]
MLSEDLTPPAEATTGAQPPPVLDVSVVIPCLNEAPTIGDCVHRALAAIEAGGFEGEVVVADNGSTDASAALAEAAGARVVHEPRPGYGAAYLAGLGAARGRMILMGDADGTYDFGQLSVFVETAERTGAELVMGSRFRGRIERGAMPWHHRYIGNPVLSGILRWLFHVQVSDAHCGLRLVRRGALPALDLHSPGMEFASEMVVAAARRRMTIAEVPIVYSARPEGSTSKLRSMRDGLRHLSYMLSNAPARVFWIPAAILVAMAAGLMIADSGGTVARAASAGAIALTAAIGETRLFVRLHDPSRRLRGKRAPQASHTTALAALIVATLSAGAITAAGLGSATTQPSAHGGAPAHHIRRA